MSAAPQFRLKKPTGWFAAGHEVDDALSLLSDGAFRLFMWLCLHADRSRGSIRATPSGLVRTTGRSQEQIASALDELVRKRICILYIDEVIEIADRFWPYRRVALPQPLQVGPAMSAEFAAHSWRGVVSRVPSRTPTSSLQPNFTRWAFP